MKYLITSAVFFILFLLFTLYAPVFYTYHVDKYNIGDGGQFCMFWGFVVTGVALLAGIAAPIMILTEHEPK